MTFCCSLVATTDDDNNKIVIIIIIIIITNISGNIRKYRDFLNTRKLQEVKILPVVRTYNMRTEMETRQ
jgi:hypothetical protein